MQFTYIHIIGLFGLYDYNVDLFFDAESKITILTGPNGYGKTTILRILSNLNPENLFYFYNLTFKTIEIGLSDSSRIVVKQTIREDNESITGKDSKRASIKEVRFDWYNSDGELKCSLVYNPVNVKKAIKDARYRTSSLWGISYEDEAEWQKILLNNKAFNEAVSQAQGQGIFVMQLEGISTKFIHANRIYNEANQENEELPIQKIRHSLQKRLKSLYNDFLESSQRIDSRFINKVIDPHTDIISKDVYDRLLRDVEVQMNELVEYRLTSKVAIPVYNEGNSSVLYAYLTSLKEKYDRYGNWPQKIRLFNDLLKAKKFANKTITFSPQHGFRIESTNGDVLEESTLSSGEQNEIVMLYELIFNVSDNSVLLIDEPENSLHLAWQKVFWQDMQLISSTKKLQVIIATHSSSIVSRGRDYAIDLYYLRSR